MARRVTVGVQGRIGMLGTTSIQMTTSSCTTHSMTAILIQFDCTHDKKNFSTATFESALSSFDIISTEMSLSPGHCDGGASDL